MDGIKYTGEQIMAYGNEATYKGYVKVCFDSAAEFATPKLTTVISDGQSIEWNGGKVQGTMTTIGVEVALLPVSMVTAVIETATAKLT